MKTIKIKLIQPTTQKLAFVKLIKECSGLGLRDAKDLCDNIHDYPERVHEMPVRDWETYDYNTGATTPATTTTTATTAAAASIILRIIMLMRVRQLCATSIATTKANLYSYCYCYCYCDS